MAASSGRGDRRRSSARCVEHDLIVLPELLDEPACLLLIIHSRSIPQDLIDRAVAVDCGEDSLLCLVDREGEIGIGMGSIDQDGHGAKGHAVRDTQGPRQTQRNVAAPGTAAERYRLALADAIVTISNKAVPG